MDNLEEGVRERIARFLPRALETAIGAHKFSSVQKDKDGAVMKKHQEACKAAAAHIELLMKLAQKAGMCEDEGKAQNGGCTPAEITDLLVQAQEELGKFDVHK